MHYRAISNTVSYLEVSGCERIKAKQTDGLTSCLMLSVLATKIFQYHFLEEHKACVNNSRSSTQRNEVSIMATKQEYLVAKKETLIAL